MEKSSDTFGMGNITVVRQSAFAITRAMGEMLVAKLKLKGFSHAYAQLGSLRKDELNLLVVGAPQEVVQEEVADMKQQLKGDLA